MEAAIDYGKKKMWLKENVLFLQLDDKAVVIDMDRRPIKHYTPNQSAAFLLHLLLQDDPVHFKDMKQELFKKYAIAGDQEAKTHLTGFLNQLKGHGFLSISDTDINDQPVQGNSGPQPWEPTDVKAGGTLLSMGRVTLVKNVYVP